MRIIVLWENDELEKIVKANNVLNSIEGHPEETVDELIETTRFEHKFGSVKTTKKGIVFTLSSEFVSDSLEVMCAMFGLLYPIQDVLEKIASSCHTICKLIIKCSIKKDILDKLKACGDEFSNKWNG
jgi:hypothetical protein